MSDFKRILDFKKNKFAGNVKEVTGKVTGNEQLQLKGRIQSSKAELKKNMNVEDKINDIRNVIARSGNDKNDRNEKQMNFTYWANINNVASSQIILRAQESLPEIHSIKRFCMIIVIGRMIMQLNDQKEQIYSPGSVIEIPSRTRMKIRNISSDKTTILVMKF